MSSLLFKLLVGKGAISEAIETFRLNLSNPSGGATLAKSFGTATIQQNPILLDVSLSRSTGKAPLSIGFDATGTTSALTTNPSHDIYYIWDFGDDKSEVFTRGATPGQNMNVSYGDVAGHVYKTAGIFTWNVTAIDGNGNVQTKSGSVTVSDWAMADTIYISNGSVPVAGVNGVLSGAAGYYNETTWAGVFGRFATNKRVLLNRASTWACATSTTLPSGAEVGAFGAGSAPVVTSNATGQSPFVLSAGQVDCRVIGIKHSGAGEGVDNSGMVVLSSVTPSHTLIMDCEADGSTWGVLSSISCIETFIQNCNFHNFVVTPGLGIATNIAVYMTDSYGLYILGCNLSDAPSHIVRMSGAQRFVFDSNRLRRPDLNGVGRDAFTLRAFEAAIPANWSGVYTEKCVITNNDIDTTDVPTAVLVLQIKTLGTSSYGRFRRLLVERNFVASLGAPFDFQNVEMLTFRANIGVATGVSSSGSGVLSVLNSSLVGSPDPVNISICNNTFYMPNITSAYPVITLGSTTTQARVLNNLAYSPNQAVSKMLETSGGPTPTQSNNSTDTQVRTIRPWASASPSSAADFTPYGSYAVDGGVVVASVQRDFFNIPMVGAREIGAIQV